MLTNRLRLAFALAVLAFTACKKDIPDDVLPALNIPDSYTFSPMSFAGQTDRLNQLDELMTYMETAAKNDVSLNLSVLRDMFANTGENGGGNFSFSSTRQLRNKCFEPHLILIDGWFQSLVEASLERDVAGNGVSGIMKNASGETPRLYAANGMEYSQIIQKTLMGAVFYYQALNTYLSSEGLNVDNDEVIEGEGTKMQHHWDEAFGYFGAPNDFPANTDDARYWARYAARREALLGTATDLSLAFRTGREAINSDRYDIRDLAAEKIYEKWELVVASTAISYLNQALNNLTDHHSRNHALSEGMGFIYSLLYNPNRKISANEVDEIMGLIGDNLYEVEGLKLTAARNKLSDIYQLESVKALL